MFFNRLKLNHTEVTMKAGLFLLPSLAAVCYSAALLERDGDLLKRDSDDYTLTVYVTAAKATPKTTANQGVYVTITKTLTAGITVQKTTSSRKGTTTVFATPTKQITVYKTITDFVTKPTTVYSAPRYTTAYCNEDIEDCPCDPDYDGGATSTDGGDEISLTWGPYSWGKRQVWLDPFTTTDYLGLDPVTTDWEDWSGWEATTTTDYEDVVTTTVYGERYRHHTTTEYAPRITWYSKREAVPQIEIDDGLELGDDGYSSDLDDTIYLPFQTFDKRALKTPDCADAPQSVTVTVTSLIDKPSGLVNQAALTLKDEEGELQISRTILEAGKDQVMSSSSSSGSSSEAKTTFATSTRASK
jgi:hypothetical protein